MNKQFFKNYIASREFIELFISRDGMSQNKKKFRTGEGGTKKNYGGVNSSMVYLIYCKKFCKYHNLSTAI
jgi:hypothetical protein